jgi:hypothetical protein
MRVFTRILRVIYRTRFSIGLKLFILLFGELVEALERRLFLIFHGHRLVSDLPGVVVDAGFMLIALLHLFFDIDLILIFAAAGTVLVSQEFS